MEPPGGLWGFFFKTKSGRFENFGYVLATFEDGTELLYDPRLAYDPEKLEDQNWIEPTPERR